MGAILSTVFSDITLIVLGVVDIYLIFEADKESTVRTWTIASAVIAFAVAIITLIIAIVAE